MKKFMHRLKKYRYHIIGIVLIGAVMVMSAVALSAQGKQSAEPTPTETAEIPINTQTATPTPVSTYIPSYTPVPPITCVICTPTATPLPFPPFTMVPPYNGSTATPSPTVYVTCDVDLNGVANKYDMFLILMINTGLYKPNAQQIATVDSNGNGIFDRIECQYCYEIVQKAWVP